MAASQAELASLRADVLTLSRKSDEFASRIDAAMQQLNTENTKLRMDLGTATTQQNTRIQAFEDQIGPLVAQSGVGISIIIKEATEKFQQQEKQILDQGAKVQADLMELHSNAVAGWQAHEQKLDLLYQATGESIRDLQARVAQLEIGGGATNVPGDRHTKGYLPFKSIIPHVMKDKVEEWRRWRNKVLVYVEYVTPGMKMVLEEVQKMTVAPAENFAEDKVAECGKSFIKEDKEKIYRALQELTDGEANRVVEAVKNEDGYLAWFELHRNFEPSLRGRQGQALSDLGELMKTKARDVNETRRLVNELLTRRKMAEDIIEPEKITDCHARTILLGFLDDQTRIHTVKFHGNDTTFEAFKNAVLEFTNNASLGTSTIRSAPMQIGAVAPADVQPDAGRQPQQYILSPEKDWNGYGGDDGDEQLWIMKGGRFPGACYECGQKGHRAADCRSKGRGKGGSGSRFLPFGGNGSGGFGGSGKGFGGKCSFGSKGGFGNKGKGKGKSEYPGVCYSCNQWGHTAKFCPNAGRSGGSVRMLDGHDDGGDGVGQWVSLIKVDEEDVENFDDVYESVEELEERLNQIYVESSVDMEIEHYEVVDSEVTEDKEVMKAKCEEATKSFETKNMFEALKEEEMERSSEDAETEKEAEQKAKMERSGEDAVRDEWHIDRHNNRFRSPYVSSSINGEAMKE